ncbi:protein lifeguard 1-like [Mytilus galloprovincialis]|uniref:protein lifeguard 1-like n=1 Tax=Mytilus galloprovincialis TaxID=29158 RepID=UPI003F7BFE36
MYHDAETGFAADTFQEGSFGEEAIRKGFIRKVYGILLTQIMFTLGIMSIFLYIPEVREYSKQHIWLWILAFVMTFIILIVLACCENVRRSFPLNMIFLGLFTFFEAFLLGTVAACYEADEVMYAAAITAVVVLGLTIFAFQTKWDFTMMGGMLCVLLLVLIVFGILAAIFHNKILSMVYASIGALIFSAYIVFDTQMMLGGKHKYALSPEEYIFAALNLYLDIVNLFLFILAIFGGSRD